MRLRYAAVFFALINLTIISMVLLIAGRIFELNTPSKPILLPVLGGIVIGACMGIIFIPIARKFRKVKN